MASPGAHTRALALLATLGVGCAPPPSDGDDADPWVRHTTAGAVRGQAEGESLAFLGVPFAQPPVGALRFARPQPPEPWDGVRPATEMAPRCPQADDSFLGEEAVEGEVLGDEDCLYLNVWTPADAPAVAQAEGGGLPVFVFLHGGGNTYGGTMDPLSSLIDPLPGFEDAWLYGGGRLASAAGLVVVTPAYRLGAWATSAIRRSTRQVPAPRPAT